MQNSDFLKNKFEHFNADVPTEVWDNVAAALDKKKKRRPVFWWFSGIAAVLFVGLFAGYFWQASQNWDGLEAKSSGESVMYVFNKPVQNSKTNSINAVANADEEQENTIYKNDRAIGQNQGSNRRVRSIEVPEWMAEQDDYDLHEFVFEELMPVYEPNKVQEPQKNDLSEAPKDSSTTSPENPQIESASLPILPSTDENELKPKKWELAIFGGFSATRQQNSPYFMEAAIANSPNLEFTTNNADYLNIDESNSNFISPVIRFTLIKAGLSINRELSSRWRLESGLHYLRYGVFYENSQSWSREAQMIQVPISAHFSILQSNKVDWRIGSGVGLGYVFRQPNLVFRSEWVNSTTLMFQLNPSWSVFVQPEARMVFYDSRISQIGKLSQWYWGMNLGVVRRF